MAPAEREEGAEDKEQARSDTTESGVNTNESHQPLRGAVYELGWVGSKQQKPNLPRSSRSRVFKRLSEGTQNQKAGWRSGSEKERNQSRPGVWEQELRPFFFFFLSSPLGYISHNCFFLFASVFS